MKRMDKDNSNTILAKIQQLKIEFIFDDIGECKFDLVKKFLANCFLDTYGINIKVYG